MSVEAQVSPQPQVEGYPLHRLHAITTIDGRYAEDTADIEPFASEFGLISIRTEVETHHLVQLSKYGVIRPLTEEETTRLVDFGPNLTDEQAQKVKALEAVSDHDVQAVEKMLREEFTGTSLEDLIPYIHLFLTSEDINNISYRVMFMRANEQVGIPAIREVVEKIVSMAEPEVDTVMDGRTHGQKGVPTILGKEEMVFATRIDKQLLKLEEQKLTGKLNGAIGNFNAHYFVRPDINWQDYAKEFVEGFGLEYNPFTTQINDYDDMVEMFQTYQRINSVLLGLDQDMWRYISDHWMAQEVKDDGTTGSSTMAQKVNPIKFENSEGNIIIANGLFEAMSRKLPISRLQRDLSDSTVIRNAPTAVAYSLISYKNTLRGLGKIFANHKVIDQALQADWSTLSEAAQQLMRMGGDPDAYDKVKKAARGVEIEEGNWAKWVDGLKLTDEQSGKLKLLTPNTYVGIGPEIARQAISSVKGRTKKQKVI